MKTTKISANKIKLN